MASVESSNIDISINTFARLNCISFQITFIGNYWDGEGENEIDFIALNDFDKTAIVAEVKRNPEKISLQTLAMKTTAVQKQLSKYNVPLKTLSLNDM